MKAFLLADGFSLWNRRILALCAIWFFLVAVLYFAQHRSFRIFVNGGIPVTELNTLYKLWMMADSSMPSSTGTYLSIATTHENNEELPRQPRSIAEIIVCSGRNKLAIGLIRRQCQAGNNGWSCTYRGAPVILLSFWLMAGIPSVVMLIGILAMLLRRHVLPRTVAARTCEKCSYPLIGLTSDRCPECGTPFVKDMKKT